MLLSVLLSGYRVVLIRLLIRAPPNGVGRLTIQKATGRALTKQNDFILGYLDLKRFLGFKKSYRRAQHAHSLSNFVENKNFSTISRLLNQKQGDDFAK